jgi:hypothetical protein
LGCPSFRVPPPEPVNLISSCLLSSAVHQELQEEQPHCLSKAVALRAGPITSSACIVGKLSNKPTTSSSIVPLCPTYPVASSVILPDLAGDLMRSFESTIQCWPGPGTPFPRKHNNDRFITSILAAQFALFSGGAGLFWSMREGRSHLVRSRSRGPGWVDGMFSQAYRFSGPLQFAAWFACSQALKRMGRFVLPSDCEGSASDGSFFGSDSTVRKGQHPYSRRWPPCGFLHPAQTLFADTA